ncbi:MAG: hypothetical protein PHR90_06705 [Sphaerochaetaceae bacterium]|nr:hypothetical protein [Sphaerochaetaceae bacterium]
MADMTYDAGELEWEGELRGRQVCLEFRLRFTVEEPDPSEGYEGGIGDYVLEEFRAFFPKEARSAEYAELELLQDQFMESQEEWLYWHAEEYLRDLAYKADGTCLK